jgi:pimeloyl-ACP methyl ester carboxylesterase
LSGSRRIVSFVKQLTRVTLWTGLAVLAILAVAAAAGAAYQVICSVRDGRRYPPPGQLIDIGGYRLHMYCKGTGSPAVILNSASFDTVSDWVWLQLKLASVTRVCAYDRAGLGWSDFGPEPHDPKQDSLQLHSLLANAGIQGPLLLVGHSFGGLYARHYAAQYPQDVAGMVLIEATPPDFLQRAGKPEVMPNADEMMINAGPYAARLGILRLVRFVELDSNLPARQRAELSAFYSSNKFADSALSSFRSFPSILAEVRVTGPVGAKPLAIVIGGKSENASGQPFELQRELATLSSDSIVHIVAGADHTSLVRNENHAAATARVILAVVDSVRSQKPLRSLEMDRY